MGRRRYQRLGLVAAVLTIGLTVGVAPVIGDGTNRKATPNETILPATVPATHAQVASNGAGLSQAVTSGNKKKKKAKVKRVFVESRITDSATPIETDEGRGTYVGIKCPGGSVAISGGVLTSYINLLISSSAPNHPITGKYTPRIWWLTVSNSNIDGEGGTQTWRGMVNCMAPVKIRTR
ncbi:MAG: hypothetical protein WBP55_08165 [Solirubrobacterales bacterium]